jgi:3-hydroxyacyl-[acyl-carrier-protein] dehydratase
MIDGNVLTNINIVDIMKLLPHRYPMLLIDRVSEIIIHKKLTAIKNVSINEPFFIGHFMDFPVMPGVLIIEAIAQAAGILLISGVDHINHKQALYLLASINKTKFKKQVIPGDQLVIEIELLHSMLDFSKFKGKATVSGKIAAETEIMIAKKK